MLSKRPSSPPLLLELRSHTWFICGTAFIATFTDSFIYGAVVPVLPFSLVERSNVSKNDVQFWVSALLVVFGAALIVGSPLAGWAASRDVPRKAQFLLGLGLAFASTLLYCFGHALWVLVIARAAQGFSSATVYLISMIIVAESVPSAEIGSWVGMVLSGLNLGLLMGPFLAGIIYDRAGYYAVFGTILGIIAFDFILRLAMIEKQYAMQWQAPNPDLQNEDSMRHAGIMESQKGSAGLISSYTRKSTGDDHENTPLLQHQPDREKSWFQAKLPTVAILLRSPRLMTAIGGAFTQAVLVTAFDPILPIFVNRTFGWGPAGGGLIFLTICVPAVLGSLSGALADVYGPKLISLLGFALAIPSLAALAAITHDALFMKVLLCILLTLAGIGLSFILAPLTSDIYGEVTVLARDNPNVINAKTAFTQAYAMFNAAMGLGCMLGPGLAGFIYGKLGWQATAAAMAITCALGGLQVYFFTGSSVLASEQQSQSDI